MSRACPICGDPRAFLFWIDAEPPAGCAHDETWHETGRLTTESVRNVTECRFQMGKAWQAAEFRKLVPDAFDADSKMLPGQLARVIKAFGEAHPGKSLII